jgi:hypothetical protein
MVNGQTGEQLIALVKEAIRDNRLLIFLFHGVGGEHGLDVSLDAHHRLLQFLQQNATDVWTATTADIVAYVKTNQPKKG